MVRLLGDTVERVCWMELFGLDLVLHPLKGLEKTLTALNAPAQK